MLKKKVFVKKSVRVLLKNFKKNFLQENSHGGDAGVVERSCLETVYYVVVRGFEPTSFGQRGLLYDW